MHFEPAASLYTMRRALVHHRPRVLMFSGHSACGEYLMLESPDGHLDADATTPLLVALLRSLSTSPPSSEPPSIEELASEAALEAHLEAQQQEALGMQHCGRSWMEAAAAERAADDISSGSSPQQSRRLSLLARMISPAIGPGIGQPRGAPAPNLALSRLACIVLNSCDTLRIGKALVRALPPGVALVCWSTLTEDSAARAFIVGFYQYLAAAVERPSVLPWAVCGPPRDGLELVHAAFAAGCDSFSRGGFRFGDPAEYLHPPDHPHWRAPQFSQCTNCAPPVQGKVVLLYTRHDVERGRLMLEQVEGRASMAKDKRSWRRQWRVLLLGMRLAERTGWSTTNEAVRDLHRQVSDGNVQPAKLAKQRSDNGQQGSQSLLHPEVGTASELKKPGAFRRAHVAAQKGNAT